MGSRFPRGSPVGDQQAASTPGIDRRRNAVSGSASTRGRAGAFQHRDKLWNQISHETFCKWDDASRQLESFSPAEPPTPVDTRHGTISAAEARE